MIEIYNEPCECPPGTCRECFGEDDDGQCVNRLKGVVRILRCSRCNAGTWHQDDNCLKCRYRDKAIEIKAEILFYPDSEA